MQKKHLLIFGIVLLVFMAGAFVYIAAKDAIKDEGQTKSGEFVPACTDELIAGGLQCALDAQAINDNKCKKHGEIPDYIPTGDDMGKQCCVGLAHRIQKDQYDEECTSLFEKFGSGGYAGICLNCGNGICESEVENKCNCPEDCAAVKSCVKEDGYVDHPDKNSFECCNGLVKVSSFPLDDNCQPDIMPNSPGPELGWACINCGDGECSGQYENKCNCPEDCFGSECVKEGNSYTDLSHITGIPQAGCCPGLESGIFYSILNGECVRSEDAQACIDCPNGECGAGENKCNCPEDCDDENHTVIDAITYNQDKTIPDLNNKEIIYKKEASWGPCSNPEGGCWEKVYLYSDGAVNTETKSGTVSQSINIGEVGVIVEYIRSSGLLTDKCEYDPVLDLAKYYSLSLDGINKKITFPGCETKLNQLDDLIEAASLDILSGESITVKAQKGLYEYLARNDKYSLDILELTLENFIELCRYDEAGNPIEEDSCWPLRYPGRSLKEKIMNIEPELETLYHVSFSYNSKHLIGCGLDGGLVLISDRGRIFKTEERKLCIEN